MAAAEERRSLRTRRRGRRQRHHLWRQSRRAGDGLRLLCLAAEAEKRREEVLDSGEGEKSHHGEDLEANWCGGDEGFGGGGEKVRAGCGV